MDLSYGEYRIRELKLQNCSDKGMSAGERANVNVKSIEVNHARLAIAVKDSAEARLTDVRVKDAANCIAVYRKKTEFLGGELRVDKINCPDSKIYVQNNSTFLNLKQ